MNITKCDICKKKIEGDSIRASSSGFLGGKDFCQKCGKPILDFLKKHNFIKKSKNNPQLSNSWETKKRIKSKRML